jgi:hypothetical protein
LNLHSFDYGLFYKEQVTLDALRTESNRWDRFISGFNQSERVNLVFESIASKRKDWWILPDYGFSAPEYPRTGSVFVSDLLREDDYVLSYWENHPVSQNERLCVDLTGLMRPHLMFLIKWLFLQGVKKFDCLYSEPLVYAKADRTLFSDEIVTEVRQVTGFEGSHTPSSDEDLLVVGCGYDHKLIEFVVNHKARARKIQLFPFPALRPHMYQENRLRTSKASESFGASIQEICFAPAYDPFVTADVLQEIFMRWENRTGNLYLSPLATKPQVAGFALFYLLSKPTLPTSIIFPFSNAYSKKTSDGISVIWKYVFEFP